MANALAPDAPPALVEEIYAHRFANPPDAAGWQAQAERARDFVTALWDPKLGRFWVGTLPDGVTINRANSGLDAANYGRPAPEGNDRNIRSTCPVEHSSHVGFVAG